MTEKSMKVIGGKDCEKTTFDIRSCNTWNLGDIYVASKKRRSDN